MGSIREDINMAWQRKKKMENGFPFTVADEWRRAIIWVFFGREGEDKKFGDMWQDSLRGYHSRDRYAPPGYHPSVVLNRERVDHEF
jgi:hypothetical protein